MDHRAIRDEIINFVRNSPEEVNSKVAVFIAGMQAQKNLIKRGGRRSCQPLRNMDDLDGRKNVPLKK